MVSMLKAVHKSITGVICLKRARLDRQGRERAFDNCDVRRQCVEAYSSRQEVETS